MYYRTKELDNHAPSNRNGIATMEKVRVGCLVHEVDSIMTKSCTSPHLPLSTFKHLAMKCNDEARHRSHISFA